MKIIFATFTRHDEPLGIMYLAAVLKKHGHEVRGVLLEKEDMAAAMEEFKPEAVAYSAMSCEKSKVLDLNAALKKRYRFFSLVGGPLASFSPEIIENNGIDAVCIGEGEEAMVEFAQAFEMKRDISKIQNLWVKVDSGIFKNEVRPLIKDLDSIPFPDRMIFKACKADKASNVISNRGCPYNCTYCHNKKYKELYKGKGSIVRSRSIDNLLKELGEIVKSSDPSIFLFQDDHFCSNLKTLKDFSAKYRALINKPFTCSLRPEACLNEEVVKTLKEAGCNSVYTACEAGNDRIRKDILKRNISKKQLTDACDLLNKYGINIILQNMIGIPTGDFENDIETLELNIRCKPYYGWASICTPYPGTELFAIAEKAGQIPDGYLDKYQETYHFTSSLRLPYLDKLNLLHKVFALAVEYPSLLPAIKDPGFYKDTGEPRIRELKKIFDSFKNYKYEKLCDPGLQIPQDVSDFVDGLAGAGPAAKRPWPLKGSCGRSGNLTKK